MLDTGDRSEFIHPLVGELHSRAVGPVLPCGRAVIEARSGCGDDAPVFASLLERRGEETACARDDGQHDRDRYGTDHDGEHGEDGAELLAADVAPPSAELVAEFHRVTA